MELQRCVLDCQSLLMQFSNLPEQSTEHTFTKLYEEALEELLYMLDINRDIRQEMEAIHEEIRGWFTTDEEVCEEEEPITVSVVPSSEPVEEEEVEETVPETPPIVIRRVEKTDYVKKLDAFFNRGQANILQQAKGRLRNLEVDIGRVSVKLALITANCKIYLDGIEVLKKKKTIVVDKRYKTMYELGMYKQHLTWFQSDKNYLKKKYRMNCKKIKDLKMQLRIQGTEETRIRRAKRKPAKLLALYHRENTRQTNEYTQLMEKFNKVEERTWDIKMRMNCEAKLRIFPLPDIKPKKPNEKEPLNFFWVERDSYKIPKKTNKPNTTTKNLNVNRYANERPKSIHGRSAQRAQSQSIQNLNSKCRMLKLPYSNVCLKPTKIAKKSPDYLTEFKAKFGPQTGQTPVSQLLKTTTVADVQYSVLKKREGKNYPLRQSEVLLDKDLKHEEYLLMQAQEAEDLVKIKHAQLEKELEKVVRFREYWEKQEADLRQDVKFALSK